MGGRMKPLVLTGWSIPEFIGSNFADLAVDFPFDPIDRWWGGTHLTNEHLWRYDPVLTKA